MSLKLINEDAKDYTFVSNIFIDEYMPAANGEFVKIYLFLLRAFSAHMTEFSVSSMADLLGITETDICRALRYWEGQGILSIDKDVSGKACGLRLLTPVPTGAKAKESTEDFSDLLPAKEPEAKIPASKEVTDENEESLTAGPKIKKMSAARINYLKKQEEISQLLYIIEQYMGHPLSASHVKSILYIYDEMHFSTELIEYLVEYCIEKGSSSMRYIETVAAAWHAQGIDTVDKARESAEQYSTSVFAVLKSFGIKGRNPVNSEMKFIRKWMDEYGFNIALITQACERTVLKTHQASFEYADRILSHWKESGVKVPEDVARLDAQHKQSAATQISSAKESAEDVPAKTGKKKANRFHNFEQRTYDFRELEKKLMESQQD